jgi:hypothetical protein
MLFLVFVTLPYATEWQPARPDHVRV